MTRIVVLSDAQVPDHDPKVVQTLIDFVRYYKPDVLAHVGDELDSPEPSRWNKGMAGEYAGTLKAGIAATHDMMAAFRAAHGKGKPFIVSRSNHTTRVETYVRKYAPALHGLDALRVETMLGYDELGIEFVRKPHEIAPGWLLMHGDEGGLSRIPGSTAMGLARRTGMSVVCGHTHKLGLQHESRGFNGKLKTIYGLEVGHTMRLAGAHYLMTGGADWQQGFGLLEVDGKRVQPTAVPIINGRFTVDRRTFGV